MWLTLVLALISSPALSQTKKTKLQSQNAPQPKKLNRIKLVGGIGPGKTIVKEEEESIVVKKSMDPIVGVGYERLMSNEWSIGVQVISNQTYTLGVGYDF